LTSIVCVLFPEMSLAIRSKNFGCRGWNSRSAVCASPLWQEGDIRNLIFMSFSSSANSPLMISPRPSSLVEGGIFCTLKTIALDLSEPGRAGVIDATCCDWFRPWALPEAREPVGVSDNCCPDSVSGECSAAEVGSLCMPRWVFSSWMRWRLSSRSCLLVMLHSRIMKREGAVDCSNEFQVGVSLIPKTGTRLMGTERGRLHELLTEILGFRPRSLVLWHQKQPCLYGNYFNSDTDDPTYMV